MSECKVCGLGLVVAEEKEGICHGCKVKQADQKVEAIKQGKIDEYDSILLTTESNPNIKITKRIEIITAECVFGMNLFRDFFAGVRDIVGGRSKASQKVLRDLRKTVLHELRLEAIEVGANAVVGVHLDYSEMSGKGSSLLFVVASGTAVVIENDS